MATKTTRTHQRVLSAEQRAAAEAFLQARHAFITENTPEHFEANNAAYNAMWDVAGQDRPTVLAMLEYAGLRAHDADDYTDQGAPKQRAR